MIQSLACLLLSHQLGFQWPDSILIGLISSSVIICNAITFSGNIFTLRTNVSHSIFTIPVPAMRVPTAAYTTHQKMHSTRGRSYVTDPACSVLCGELHLVQILVCSKDIILLTYCINIIKWWSIMSPGKKLGDGSIMGRYTTFVLAHTKHTHSKNI